jgi:hypothetical protein
LIVLLTIHGIGFQRVPTSLAASDGYADALHEGLRRHLGKELGDDPFRRDAGGRGPVYVQSNYPPLTARTEAGLSRLGTWTDAGEVDITGMPLAENGASIAHVALVYSGLEEKTGDVPALIGIAVLANSALTDYATLGGLAQMAIRDLEALRQHPRVSGDPISSLQPRKDPQRHRGSIEGIRRHLPPSAAPPDATAHSILATVEDDVAAYVARNEHRERVRAFLRDAASRLLTRPDVSGIVVNGHSNGTIMGYDLIGALSPPSAIGVHALITSGCPLRKYVDLLDWGQDAGNMRLMTGPWTNFWDVLDPVADPLAPHFGWKRGDPDRGGPGMCVVHDPDTGATGAMPTTDISVNNVLDSKGTGLRAHNYWDNPNFCASAAEILKQVPS